MQTRVYYTSSEYNLFFCFHILIPYTFTSSYQRDEELKVRILYAKQRERVSRHRNKIKLQAVRSKYRLRLLLLSLKNILLLFHVTCDAIDSWLNTINYFSFSSAISCITVRDRLWEANEYVVVSIITVNPWNLIQGDSNKPQWSN